MLHSDRRRRPGKAALIVLLLLPVLLLAAAIALYASETVEFRTELQNAADASSLAAVQVFVDDRVLVGRKDNLLELLRSARAEADRYAAINPALGVPVQLAENPTNDPRGDVVFGSLDRFRDPTLVVANLKEDSGAFLSLINAVRVHVRRTKQRGNPGFLHGAPLLGRQPTDLEAVATAMLDKDVIGFRPTKDGVVPLAPIALLSDPEGKDENSWEYNVERRKGPDRSRYHRGRRRPEPGSDGLHEMPVKLSRGKGAATSRPSGCLVQLGADGPQALAEQLVHGVRRDHLAAFGGELVLGPANRLLLPGTPYVGGQSAGLLRAALRELAREGSPRVFLLYRDFDGKTVMPVITGFVAARVVAVRDRDGGDDGTGVGFVVQPCMMSVPAAVTDASRRGVGGIPVLNRYICKVRLVE